MAMSDTIAKWGGASPNPNYGQPMGGNFASGVIDYNQQPQKPVVGGMSGFDPNKALRDAQAAAPPKMTTWSPDVAYHGIQNGEGTAFSQINPPAGGGNTPKGSGGSGFVADPNKAQDVQQQVNQILNPNNLPDAQPGYNLNTSAPVFRGPADTSTSTIAPIVNAQGGAKNATNFANANRDSWLAKVKQNSQNIRGARNARSFGQITGTPQTPLNPIGTLRQMGPLGSTQSDIDSVMNADQLRQYNMNKMMTTPIIGGSL